MPWCPKCGAEYVENVRKCKDCGVRLLDHKPTPDEMLPPDPKPTGWRRFVTRERFLRVLKTLIAILLALAAVYSLRTFVRPAVSNYCIGGHSQGRPVAALLWFL